MTLDPPPQPENAPFGVQLVASAFSYCECESLKPSLTPTAVFSDLKNRDEMSVDLFLDSTMTCTGGLGSCFGSIDRPWSRSPGVSVSSVWPAGPRLSFFEWNILAGEPIVCEAPCGKTGHIERERIRLTGDRRYGFGRRGKGQGSTAVLSWRVECGGKRTTRTFTVAFDPDSGKLDYDRSDLNGDGKPDGA